MSIKKIFENKTAKDVEDISVIIPAAGLGRRMKSYGPKSLIKVNNETLIDRQIRLLEDMFPANRLKIILVCGFEATKLMNSTPDRLIKIENENFDSTNVSRSVAMGLRATDSPNIIVLHGDLFLNKDALACLSFSESSALVTYNNMNEEEVGCILNEKNYIENFMYDLPCKWGQVIFLRDRELSIYKKFVWNSNFNNVFNFEVLNEILKQKGKIKACFSEQAIAMDLDNSKDIEKASKL